MKLTFDLIKNNEEIRVYIQKADEMLIALGYTEHSFAHVTRAAKVAAWILEQTGHSEKQVELAAVAGYLHDIGNMINRDMHEISGAIMVFQILNRLGADPTDIALVVGAIGNHDEGNASPVSDIAAALILADKTDVRRSRVRNKDNISFDIHDRVNYAVENSDVQLDVEKKEIILNLSIDTSVSSISDYFEIFLDRMLLCKRAAEKLGLRFGLIINKQSMM
ncbi:MAG: HD domain-containing protein [Eubacteriales bacterium]|nr:HD domain-containing protein [Eubacteriales bacterium]